jgi:alkylation response protein AidB-like acyl-CoA dehydrogenase
MYFVHDVFRGLGLSIHYCQTGRATRNFTIFEGTSGIQRMIIGRAVTGLNVR